MEKIKSAVIGCGRMGAFPSDLMKKYGPNCWFPLSHIEALKELKNVSVESICDIDSSLLKNASEKHDIKNIYDNYNKLFSNHKIDLVSIATRTKERFEIIQAAIENGVKAIHVEKPLCNSIEQLKEIENIVSHNNVCLSYGTLRRYLNIYQKAKDLVDSGRFGKLRQIQVNFGESALFWTHPHSVDIILFFSGDRKLEAVQSNLSNVILSSKKNVESDPLIEQASMYFDEGLVGTISKIPGMDVILGCEKGVISIDSNGSQILTKMEHHGSPYFQYSENLITDISSGPQGTYSAISNLINNMNNKDYKKNEYIFLGQRVLFGFVDSHLNNGKLIEIESISDQISVLGKSGNLYS